MATTTGSWANASSGLYNQLTTTVSKVSTLSQLSNTTRRRRGNNGGGNNNNADLSTIVNLILSYYRAFGLPVIILVGVIGNCFVLYIFARHSVGVSRSTRVYYVLLALVDCSSLLTYNLAQFLGNGLNTISARTFNIQFETLSDFVCGLDRYMFYLSEALSNYFYMVLCHATLALLKNYVINNYRIKVYPYSSYVIQVFAGMSSCSQSSVLWPPICPSKRVRSSRSATARWPSRPSRLCTQRSMWTSSGFTTYRTAAAPIAPPATCWSSRSRELWFPTRILSRHFATCV